MAAAYVLMSRFGRVRAFGRRTDVAELALHGLAKSYGARDVLRDVDLVVPEGTLTAILGASGSGKTTLLRLIIGFIAPDRGTIAIGGSVVADAGGMHVAPDKREVGYVAQEGALFPHLTVAENVAFGLPARGAQARRADRRGARPRRARPRLRRSAARTSSPAESSAASRSRERSRRARGSCCSTSRSRGSTQHLRAETRAAVAAALAAEGATAVLVTHDQAEALSMGREVAVLRAGRLAQTATPAVLYRDAGRSRRRAFRRRRRRRSRATAARRVVELRARRARASEPRRRGRGGGDDPARADPPVRARRADAALPREVRRTHSYYGPDTVARWSSTAPRRTRRESSSAYLRASRRPRRRARSSALAVSGPVAVYPPRTG